MTPPRQLIGLDVTLMSFHWDLRQADWSRNYVANLGCFNLNDRARISVPVVRQIVGYLGLCYNLSSQRAGQIEIVLLPADHSSVNILDHSTCILVTVITLLRKKIGITFWVIENSATIRRCERPC